MAVTEILLSPVHDPRRSPFLTYEKKGGNPADQLRFIAGWNLETPIHWELHRLYYKYIATAAVASRYPQFGVRKQDCLYGFDSNTFGVITAGQSKVCELSRLVKPALTDYMFHLEKYSITIAGSDYFWMNVLSDQAGDTFDLLVEFRMIDRELGVEDSPYLTVTREKTSRKGWFW